MVLETCRPHTARPRMVPSGQTVMALVVSGLLNKQVGGELGISEITVKAHRGQVMQKIKAESLADLVKVAAKLRLAGESNAWRSPPDSTAVTFRFHQFNKQL
jgi:DNA-binding NarL/FixJ family response regulator